MPSFDVYAVTTAQKYLISLMRGSRLTRQEAGEFMRLLLDGRLGPRNEFTCGALLCLLMRDALLDHETLLGLDDAMAAIARPMPRVALSGQIVAAIVGSGKDEYKTFNISTCAALVAASCGAHVAKVGCGAESSVAGTTDILQCMGLNITPSFEKALGNLELNGFSIFEVEATLPELFDLYIGRSMVFTALEFVLPAYLGIDIDTVVYGLSDERTELAGEVLRRHGRKGVVVSGVTNKGLRFDELSVLGKSKVSRITNESVETFEIHPDDIGLPLCRDEDVAAAATLAEAASLVQRILRGDGGKAQNAIVAANAGALLWVTGQATSLKDGAAMALEAVSAGKGWHLFERVRQAEIK